MNNNRMFMGNNNRGGYRGRGGNFSGAGGNGSMPYHSSAPSSSQFDSRPIRPPLLNSYREGFSSGYQNGFNRASMPEKRNFNNQNFSRPPLISNNPQQMHFNSSSSQQQRMMSLMHHQGFDSYSEDFAFYDDYLRTRPIANNAPWYEGNNAPYRRYDGPDFTHHMNNMPMNNEQLNYNMQMNRRMGEKINGYLSIHNMKKGKSGLFLINYINYLLTSRLKYNGPPVIFSRRYNENTLEATFPNIELLRSVIENLSPIMVKGNITVYITYKPAESNNRTSINVVNAVPAVSGLGHRQIQRTFTNSNKRGNARGPNGQQISKLQGKMINKKKNKSPRMRGIFSDGVQPIKVVIVADELSQHLDVEMFRSKSFEVISGNNMDAFDFIKLIDGDQNIVDDNVCYIVIPSFAFLLKSLSIFSNVDQVDDSSTIKYNIRKSEKIFQRVFSEFSELINLVDIEYLNRTSKMTDKKMADCPENTELFLRQLLYSAIYLRNAVRAKTENCEVIFCGFPTYYMDKEQIEGILGDKIAKSKVENVSESIICAMKLFNDFASNSWLSGGFKINHFGDGKLVNFDELEGSDKKSVKEDENEEEDDEENEDKEQETEQDSAIVNESNDMNEVESKMKVLTLEKFNSEGDDDLRFSLDNLAKSTLLDKSKGIDYIKKIHTGNIVIGAEKIRNFQRNKGKFLPWDKVETVGASADGKVPDIVQDTINLGIYIEHKSEEGVVTYECKHCDMLLDNLTHADHHAYTGSLRRHFMHNHRIRIKEENRGFIAVTPPIDQISYYIPLTDDFKEKLIKFKIIEINKDKTYKCLPCDGYTPSTKLNDVTLRVHIHSGRHMIGLNKMFGVSTNKSLMRHQENWSLIKKMSQYPSQDVIIVADEKHMANLKYFKSSADNVQICSVANLLSDKSSSQDSLSLIISDKCHISNALWILVAGSDIDTTLSDRKVKHNDEPIEVLQHHYSYMTQKLPVSHRVIVAPLMPLNIIANKDNTSNNEDIKNFTNSVTFDDVASFDGEKYKNLFKEVMSLHKTTATLGNVKSLGNLQCSVLKMIKEQKFKPVLTITAWHIAMRSYILSALYGMESPFLHSIEDIEPSVKVENLELDYKINSAKIISKNLTMIKKSHITREQQKPLFVQRQVKLTNDDIEYIVSKAAVCIENYYTTWYLSLDFLDLLLTRETCSYCVEQNCDRPIKNWTLKQSSINCILADVFHFVTKLQNKMPSGNLVTLMPVYPAVLVTLSPTIDAVTHSAMHLLQNETDVYYTQDVADLISKTIDDFNKGWKDLFLKTNKHYFTTGYSENMLEFTDINTAVSTLKYTNKENAAKYIATFNSLLKNFDYSFAVEELDTDTSSESKSRLETKFIKANMSNTASPKQEKI